MVHAKIIITYLIQYVQHSEDSPVIAKLNVFQNVWLGEENESASRSFHHLVLRIYEYFQKQKMVRK